MPYIPFISDYKPFYIQCQNDSNALDTSTEWGMVAKSSPYPAMPNPKEPYKNDWKDENGDDEYNEQMKYQSFSFEVSFYIKTFDSISRTAVEILREQQQSFFNHIKNGEFMVYDSYTGIGRQCVRYDGYSESNGGFVSRDNWARLIFTVKFKVNDPVTYMKLSGGSIVSV